MECYGRTRDARTPGPRALLRGVHLVFAVAAGGRWLESAQNPTNRVACWQDGRAARARGAGCNLLNTLLTGLLLAGRPRRTRAAPGRGHIQRDLTCAVADGRGGGAGLPGHPADRVWGRAPHACTRSSSGRRPVPSCARSGACTEAKPSPKP